MCGITGMIMLPRKRSEKELKILRFVFSEILKNTEDRGKDATGIYIVQKDNENILAKDAFRADIFTASEEFFRASEAINNNTTIVLGHTRNYTQGKPDNNLNNHPIEIGRIVGIHNGSIDNDYQLFNANKDKFTRIADVDSEIIFQLLNYYATDTDITREQIKQALVTERIRGSVALAFIHKAQPNIVHLIKQTNPLDIVTWKEAGIIFFNSNALYVISAFTTLERISRLIFGETLLFNLKTIKVNEDRYFTINSSALTPEEAISKAVEFKIEQRYNWSGANYRSSGVTVSTGETKSISLDTIPIFVFDKNNKLISREDGSGIIDLPWDDEDDRCNKCNLPLSVEELNISYNKNVKQKLCTICLNNADISLEEMGIT